MDTQTSFTPSQQTQHNLRTAKQALDFEAYCHCVICFDVFYEPVSLACGHTYCATCIGKVSDKRCPQCRKAWFEWPECNIWIWQLIQQELPDHVARRKEELKRRCINGTKGKQWTELTVPDAPSVIDFGRCKEREEIHKQKVREATQNRLREQTTVSASTAQPSQSRRTLTFVDF